MNEFIEETDKIAYAEVDYIIHNMNQKYIDMLPQSMLEFFDKAKSTTHEVKIDKNIPLYEQPLQSYTFDLLNVINLNYWCQDEEKKKEIISMLSIDETEEKLNKQMKSNLFKKYEN